MEAHRRHPCRRWSRQASDIRITLFFLWIIQCSFATSLCSAFRLPSTCPTSNNNSATARSSRDDALWLTVGGEDKLLPGAVVNDLLQKKLAAIEEKEGRKPGGRTRKRIKDELITELLPRAFVRPVRTDALIDRQHGVIAVDTSSRKSAESVVSEVRRALGSFPALPLNAETAPRAILTSWIAGDPLPDGLALGDECELRDPVDSGAVVKIQRMDLSGEEIAKHLDAGKQATRLALVLDDHVSFVLGEDLIVRKFKLLDGAVDQLESSGDDDIVAELQTRFALMAGEFKRLFGVLEAAFRLSQAQ